MKSQIRRRIGGLHITGVNALTRERQRLDGKWILCRLPSMYRTQYAGYEATFDASYPHVIEEYRADWFQLTEE